METPENIIVRVGSFEGIPIYQTITAKQIKEAKQAGMTERELIDLELSTYRDWQADC